MIVIIESLTEEQSKFKEALRDKILLFYNNVYLKIQSEMPSDLRGQLNLLADRNSCSSNTLFYIENIIFIKEYCDNYDVERVETKDKVLYVILKDQFPIIYTGSNRLSTSALFYIIRPLVFYTLWAIRCIINKSSSRIKKI